MDMTSILAIYGAILGTLGFGLSIYLAVRDYKKEKRIVKVILEYVGFYEHYQVRIVNTNFRSITISNIGCRILIKRGRIWLPAEDVPSTALLDIPKPDFPITLEDGETVILRLQQVLSSFQTNKERRLEVYVYDAEGNMYNQTESKIYNPKFNKYEKF